MKTRFLILMLAAAALAGCSNLTLQCSGTYTGDEVRDVERK